MQISLALILMTRRTWLRRLQAAAALGLLMSGSALAQTASDPKVQTANAEWRRLSQTEVNCVDKALRAQRSGVWLVIQRGVRPTDAAMATVRAACRTQVRAPNPAASPATVAHVVSQAEVVMAAGERTPPEEAAGKKPAAERVASDAPAGDKITLEKAAADKAAADKAAADKAAAEKATADKIAADKPAADKAAAEKAAADKAAAEKAAMARAAADKPQPAKAATDKAAAGNAALELARADAERATAEAAKARADADLARKEAEKTIADVGLALAAAESKLAFICGLIAGVMLLGIASMVFLGMRRTQSAGSTRSDAAMPESVSREQKYQSDRLFAAFLDEQKRRDARTPKPAAPARRETVEEPALF